MTRILAVSTIASLLYQPSLQKTGRQKAIRWKKTGTGVRRSTIGVARSGGGGDKNFLSHPENPYQVAAEGGTAVPQIVGKYP